MPGTRVAIDKNVSKFVPVDISTVFVLGTNGVLWHESAPFGGSTLNRFEVAAGVSNFKMTSAGQLLVMLTDKTLWLYDNPNQDTIIRQFPTQIDANVADFCAPYNTSSIFILGTNGNLWWASPPFGKPPPPRVAVDEGVVAFVPWSTNDSNNPGVLVLGAQQYERPLLLELPPFGSLPPRNVTTVDKNVAQFEQYDFETIYVLGTDGNLWVEKAPFGTVPPARTQIDGNVKTFRYPNPDYIYVLSSDEAGILWLEFPQYGGTPPPRVQIDSNVATMEAFDEYSVFVLDRQGALWLWTGPFSWLGEGGGPGENDPGAGDGGGGYTGWNPGGTEDPPDPDNGFPSTGGI
jgi:hypothetical protein